MPARGGGIAILKWATSFPHNPARGLPVVQGMICVSDEASGSVRALVDVRAVTALRTGAVAAVAAQELAREDARTVGIVGCGLHGSWAARCLAAAEYGPGICFDPSPEAAGSLAGELGWEAGTREDALACDVVTCVTPGSQPVVRAGEVHPGTHLNMLGADGPGKAEAEIEVVESARLFCDEWAQAMNKGIQKSGKLWSRRDRSCCGIPELKPWAGCRREDLLRLLEVFNDGGSRLDVAVQKAAEEDVRPGLLMTQPGVGPNTALCFVLTMGDVSRFARGKQVASYLGLIPLEKSSGKRQRLGKLTKQGNRLMRMLLVEAAQSTVRYEPGFRKHYLHLCHKKPKGLAKVAAARKLAVRMYWMLRTQTRYPDIVRIESSSRVPLVGAS